MLLRILKPDLLRPDLTAVTGTQLMGDWDFTASSRTARQNHETKHETTNGLSFSFIYNLKFHDDARSWYDDIHCYSS